MISSQHKKWVGEVFDRAAAGYGQASNSFFLHYGARLAQLVAPKPGQRGLDVATGRGAVLFPLAQAVGTTGKIVGIDISQQMLNETQKEVTQRKLDWVELKRMDAEHLDFPDNTFDFVSCGFCLFFLPSIPTALAEFKRVLKPGGKLAVSIWGEDSELDTLMNEEIDNVGTVKGLAATPLWTKNELQQVLAPFNQVQIHEETKRFGYASFDEWWNGLWTHGTRARFEQLSQSQITLLREQLKSRAVDLTENLQVLFGIGVK